MEMTERYTGEYRLVDGSLWSFELDADSFEDAERKLDAIRDNGKSVKKFTDED